MADFNESDHPRVKSGPKGGQFTSSGGGSSPSAKTKKIASGSSDAAEYLKEMLSPDEEKNFKKIREGMKIKPSSREMAVGENWNYDHSANINNALMNRTLSEEIKRDVRVMDDLVSRKKIPDDMKVYRATNMRGVRGISPNGIRVGNVLNYSGFTSVTISKEVAREYAGKYDHLASEDEDTTYLIESIIPKGSNAAWMGNFEDDPEARDELVLPRGASWRVVEVSDPQKSGGRFLQKIKLEYSPPPASYTRGDSEAKMIRAAGVLLLAGDNALFVKRSEKGDHPGEWCFPGGKIEEGESAEQAARRELAEETGLTYDGPLVPHTRKISTGEFLSQPVDPSITPPEPVEGVDFTTFVGRVEKEFTPMLNDEHDGFAWAPIKSPPRPLHPGCEISLGKFSMTELDVARALVSGDLTSPQQFMNVWLFLMRITGTGTAYRSALDEHVYRPPENYLTEDFLMRCAGLPVIIDHPKGNTMDHDSFRERIVGTILLPFVMGDEVWGVAKIYDQVAAKMMIDDQLSTSPAVVFRKSSGNSILHQADGSKLLIEGIPALLDHLAICERGVWDKGGEPSGIVSIRGDSDVSDEDKARKDEMLDKTLQGIGDTLSTVMKRMDDLSSMCDGFKKRFDSEDEEKAKADAARKDAEEKEAEEKAKADAEAEEKAKADAAKKDAEDEEAKKAEAARADSFEKKFNDLQSKFNDLQASIKPRGLDDEAKFAAIQSRADEVARALGSRAEAPMHGETLMAYRRRMLAIALPHSPRWKGFDLTAVGDNDTIISNIENDAYADAMAEARSPARVPDGHLIQRDRPLGDGTGRTVREYHGDPKAWMSQFMNVPRIGYFHDLNQNGARRLN